MGGRIFNAKTQRRDEVQPRMSTDEPGLNSPQENPRNSSGAGSRRESQSLSGNSLLGRTGHWPVPPGDSPGGMGSAPRGNEDGSCAKSRRALPVGGSPTGTGDPPVPPIFQTGSGTAGLVGVHARLPGPLPRSLPAGREKLYTTTKDPPREGTRPAGVSRPGPLTRRDHF
jgi:hypothetical protein